MPTSPPTRCATCGELKKGPCPNGCDSWKGRPSGNWTPEKAHDPRWKRIQSVRLSIEPLCRFCEAPAKEVDHLDGTNYFDDSGEPPSWLSLEQTRSLCTPHHRQRTQAQSAAARRKQ
jgi:hypothetical protein